MSGLCFETRGVTRRVQFFFGLGSRYSYLASTQINALEKDAGCAVAWLPMVSSDLMNRRGQNPFAARDAAGNWSGASVSSQYDERYRQTDLLRWAKLYDVPYKEPVPPVMNARRRTISRRRTLYCVAAEMLGQGAQYSTAMFNSMYVDNVATTEDDCRRRAREIGVDPDKLCDLVESGAAGRRNDEIIALALELKVFGVPSFVVGGELFWGNDRLQLLRHYLKRTSC